MAIRDTGTEKLIKETAKRVFFAEGKLHATTQDIADAAGISRTSLHYYFRSKDTLLKLVFIEAITDLNALQYSLMISTLPFREKIENMVNLFLTDVLAYPYRETFLIIEMLANDIDIPEIKIQSDPHVKVFMNEIEAEMKAGTIATMPPVQFMMNMIALMTHPLIVSPLNKALFDVSDADYIQLMNDRKKLIVEMLFR